MEDGRYTGLLVVKEGKVVREEGVAKEADGGLFKIALGQQEKGAVNLRSHHVLLKREGDILVAVYQ